MTIGVLASRAHRSLLLKSGPPVLVMETPAFDACRGRAPTPLRDAVPVEQQQRVLLRRVGNLFELLCGLLRRVDRLLVDRHHDVAASRGPSASAAPPSSTRAITTPLTSRPRRSSRRSSKWSATRSAGPAPGRGPRSGCWPPLVAATRGVLRRLADSSPAARSSGRCATFDAQRCVPSERRWRRRAVAGRAAECSLAAVERQRRRRPRLRPASAAGLLAVPAAIRRAVFCPCRPRLAGDRPASISWIWTPSQPRLTLPCVLELRHHRLGATFERHRDADADAAAIRRK